MKKYVLNDIQFNTGGKKVSCGYYAGRNKKYSDMFNVVPFKKYGKQFETIEEAEKIAKPLNKVGYNFVIEEIDA